MRYKASYILMFKQSFSKRMSLLKKNKKGKSKSSLRQNPLILDLLQAVFYVIISYSDFVCYFIVLLNQVSSKNYKYNRFFYKLYY